MNTDMLVFVAYFQKHVLLRFDDNVDEKYNQFSNSNSSASGCYLAFTYFFANFRIALHVKVLLIKKACNTFVLHLLTRKFVFTEYIDGI